MADAMFADSTRLVTGGVDTHKDIHVAALVDHLGVVVDVGSFPTTRHGLQALGDWLCASGQLARVGIEGTGSWGAGLARHLNSRGIEVTEINRADRQSRRRQGKNDEYDAIAAARTALGGLGAGTPKTGAGPVEAIRVLTLTRRSAVAGRTKAINQIRAILDTAPTPLRDSYRDLTTTKIIASACAARPDPGRANDPTTAAKLALSCLAKRWRFLNQQINDLDTLLTQLVQTTAPQLVALHCVGTHTAAALLIAAGDNPDRLNSEAAFAAICGVNPIPASSGRTHRHRLNRAGNRDANNALWRIVITRIAHDQRTRDYVNRRTTEGLTKREIIRCLKRYVAREIYRNLPPTQELV